MLSTVPFEVPNAHSQMIATRHPESSSSSLTRRSRATLPLNFARQKSGLVEGDGRIWAFLMTMPEAAMHETDSSKQTAPNRRKTRSGVPGLCLHGPEDADQSAGRVHGLTARGHRG